MPSADVAVIIPAKNEADRVGATVSAARGLAGVDLVVVVDDGSADDTAAAAASAGAQVAGHQRCRGKAAAMLTGVRLVQQIESAAGGQPHHLLFLDADLGASAAGAGPLIGPVQADEADMTIAVFQNVVRLGGFGIVTATAGAGIERATGWRPVQPLNGQRCLTRAAFAAALPLAPGWGVETAMTIDLFRQGLRITEVEVPLAHRATGTDWRSQLHRVRQLRDVTRALAVREPANWRSRAQRPGQHASPIGG